MFKSITRIINWMGPLRKRVYLGFVFSVLDSIFAAFPFVVTGIMVNKMYEDFTGVSSLEMKYVFYSILFVLVAVMLRWLCSYTRSRLQDNVAYEVSRQERLSAGEILRRVPLGFFKKNSIGEINTVLTSELSFFEMFAMSMVDIVANSYLFIIIVVIAMFIIEPILGVIALIALLFSSLGLYFINKLTKNRAPMRQKAIADIAAATIEYMRGMSIIKSYNQEGMATKAYEKACEDARKINISLETIYVFPESLHRIALYLGTTGILFAVSMALARNELGIDMWIMLAL